MRRGELDEAQLDEGAGRVVGVEERAGGVGGNAGAAFSDGQDLGPRSGPGAEQT
ncbi:hypothetical protein [Streptomyces nigrescens]|uniref:hypothetical protein n=1 Tax=Streptomyces nigrescens TaxID=1920 RepID=UPI0036F7F002